MTPPKAGRPLRSIVLGVVASLALVAISTTITLLIMSHRGDAAARDSHVSTASTRSDALKRTEAPASPPASTASDTARAALPAPSASEAAAGNGGDSEGSVALPSPESSTTVATAATTPAPAPVRAAAPRAPRAARKPAKKHGRFVPSDI